MWKHRGVLRGLKPPYPTLSDGVVTLRIPDEWRDAASLRHFADAEIVHWLFGGRPPPEDPPAVFAQQHEWWRTGTNAAFSIDAEGHDERVGFTRVLFGLVDPMGFAELGYCLFPDGRGRGYATRAARLVASWVFDDLGLGRLQARTSLGNVASERVLERVGFQREGIARAGFLLPVSRERPDKTMWSLLPGELR
jgi:RimJ/RimL family protein N-acetyltransferase